jgi:hypothetical protein
MQWFRLHTEFAHDPKLNSFTKSQRYDLVVLLCLAADSAIPGTILLDDEDIAATLQQDETEFAAFVAKLEKKAIMARDEKGNLLFLHWKERQYEKPSDTPEETSRRKREQRERERQEREALQNGHANVTPMSRPVTLPEQSRAEQSRYITEQSRAEQNREATPGTELDALPACLPFVASDDSALPAKPSAPPLSVRETVADLLTEAELTDLLKTWKPPEVQAGCEILRKRIKAGKPRPRDVPAYLHTSILPEVRNAERHERPPPKAKPQKSTSEEDTERQKANAALLAHTAAAMRAKGVAFELPELPP